MYNYSDNFGEGGGAMVLGNYSDNFGEGGGAMVLGKLPVPGLPTIGLQ